MIGGLGILATGIGGGIYISQIDGFTNINNEDTEILKELMMLLNEETKELYYDFMETGDPEDYKALIESSNNFTEVAEKSKKSSQNQSTQNAITHLS